MTVQEVFQALGDIADQTLEVFVTNGDLDPAPVASVSVQAADYGQMVLVSR